MRKIKRFVSWLLVYATLLTVCLFALTALYNAGIITGDNEYKFHPDDYLTYEPTPKDRPKI